MNSADDLNWRVERICRQSWPSLREGIVGDWVFRFAEGQTRRANSANPLRDVAGDIGAAIAAAEAQYAAWGQPAIFRTLSFLDPAIDAQLVARGYAPEGETVTLYGDFVPWPMRRDPDVRIDAGATPEWLAAMALLKGQAPAQRDIYRTILEKIEIPATFISFAVDGAPAALAYGGLSDGLLCLESVITAEALRGRGYASRILGALMAWAIEQGAGGVCLQVEAHNTIAQKLYRGMGLTRELYRYRYWRQPAAI